MVMSLVVKSLVAENLVSATESQVAKSQVAKSQVAVILTPRDRKGTQKVRKKTKRTRTADLRLDISFCTGLRLRA